jgi:hypothetical protein
VAGKAPRPEKYLAWLLIAVAVAAFWYFAFIKPVFG